MMGRSSNGQAALARVSSRQCRCAAICWNAGSHIAAFESPTRATVVVEAVSPVAHSGCPTWKEVRMQPLSNMAFCSAAASASGGFEVRRYGLEVGRCRDRGLHLRERVLHRRVVRVNVGARGGGRRGDGQRGSRRAAADRDGHRYQQRHAHADRYRGGGAAERETAAAETGARERRIAGGSR